MVVMPLLIIWWVVGCGLRFRESGTIKNITTQIKNHNVKVT